MTSGPGIQWSHTPFARLKASEDDMSCATYPVDDCREFDSLVLCFYRAMFQTAVRIHRSGQVLYA